MASSAVSASGRAKKSAAGGMSGTSRKAASVTAASAAAARTVSARSARQLPSVGRSFGTYSHTIRMLLRWPGTSSTVPKKVGTRNSPMSSRDRNDSSRLA
jgi:hypothetical protein